VIAYPLDNNPDLLHVCYKRIPRSLRDGAITHIVRTDGERTLCGITLLDYRFKRPYAKWEYVIWSKKKDKLDVSKIGCLRCKSSRAIIETPAPGGQSRRSDT
jgi:hypothetical protein